MTASMNNNNEFLHDIIKIEYSNLGYLPGIPYHLISDREMFDAFLSGDITSHVETITDTLGVETSTIVVTNIENPTGYFVNQYPNLWGDMVLSSDPEVITVDDVYNNLMLKILSSIQTYLVYNTDIPDWVYSYMLGVVVSPYSSILDRHNLLVLLNADNVDDELTELSIKKCYEVSERWLRRTASSRKNYPTIFGEPHVFKALRLDNLIV